MRLLTMILMALVLTACGGGSGTSSVSNTGASNPPGNQTPTTYSISGTITSSGIGISGVTVSTSGGSATTDANGSYTISSLANGSYTVTPAKSGYTFTPATFTFALNGANATGKSFTATATTDPATIAANRALFRQAIDVLKANYFYTQSEGIDWEAVYSANVQDFASVSAVGAKIFEIMAPLKNEHFYVTPGGGAMLSSQPINYKTVPQLASYFSTPVQTLGGGTISYALTTSNVVYVNISAFPSASSVGVTQAQVNAIFDAFPSASGMVIDVRENPGGQSDIMDMFAINLVNHDVVYAYYSMNRNGVIDPAVVTDDGSRYYSKPVVGLVGPRTYSQAELFTRFLRSAGIPIVGAKEYGAEGPGKVFTVGDLKFQIPVQGMYDTGMNEVKLNPVVPDVQIAPAASTDASHDYVLEAAVAAILSR